MQPYPSQLVQRLTLRDGTPVTIRPIRPDDAELEQAFVRNLSHESRDYRFMDTVRERSPQICNGEAVGTEYRTKPVGCGKLDAGTRPAQSV